jgi:valyl-tRNA synthetase
MLEPRLMDQWFVDLTSKKGREKIVQPAIDVVKKGNITIVPDFQEKIFFHWMENIRDWNISRQIVWGIKIPVWYCTSRTGKNNQQDTRPNVSDYMRYGQAHSKKEDNFVVSAEKPDKCPICGECEMEQETDVFDTWFSSGQWPYATLLAQQRKNPSPITHHPSPTDDFERFYPTSVMETGYDIIFFWVARMMMLGMYRIGKIPFETVYLHGLVRDKDKQKMSKSKGNVVDPMGIVQEYGADALRMALLVGNSPGQDASFNEQKVKGYRNFSNKLWNIARFILTHAEHESADLRRLYADQRGSIQLKKELTLQDQKLLEEFEKVKKSVEQDIEKYRFSQAAETAYHYVWHRLADELIEEKKEILFDESADKEVQQSARKVLYELLVCSLVLLHPFMPFVTEAIYQRLPEKEKDFLMVESW